MATSAIWKMTCREWVTTFAPILMSFSRIVVNDQCLMDLDSAFILTLRMVDVGSGEIQAIKTAKVGDSDDYLVDFISPLTCQLLYDALNQ